MEAISGKAIAITALAPIIWGSTYYVTRNFLPSEYPLTGALIRALPAGLLLLLFTRKLPRGIWWVKATLISVLTTGGFFVLVYIAGSRLPSSIDSMVMALSPLFTMLMARAILEEIFTVRRILGGILSVIGVFVLIGKVQGTLDALGLLASFVGMLISALGFILIRKWNPPVSSTEFASWQLFLGGIMLLPIVIWREGFMPLPSLSALWGYVYIALFASVIGYICWYYGVTRLPASVVSIIGLLNPLAGVLLGTFLAGETLTLTQAVGCLLILVGIYMGTIQRGKLFVSRRVEAS
ncbi:EamA family transporter [uncultured Rothia sp.]|uniref:DMT family transporter n=1 Tax=uncultured Rothia sp. TaxID=316088 RepID=UPI0032175DA6